MSIPPATDGYEPWFSLVVIPDTQQFHIETTTIDDQTMVQWTNRPLERHIDWILHNLLAHRIQFVTHVGDVVDQNIPEQWSWANICLSRLEGNIPFGISPGNHDMRPNGDSTLFQSTFPKSRFSHCEWYVDCYEPSKPSPCSGNNANSLQRLTILDQPWLFLHLECNAPDKVLEWANAHLEQNPEANVVVTVHMLLGPLERPKVPEGFFTDPKGVMNWKKRHGNFGNTGVEIWHKCLAKHDNIRLILCGDQSRTQAMRRTLVRESGKPVPVLMNDYGNNWLRLLRISPLHNKFQVITFDNQSEELCESTEIVPQLQEHQFEAQLG